MPRPIRIEYKNAFYHVMNRGRARNNIFFKDIHYQTFLDILQDSQERFGFIIHSYCLMPNHYHLLVQTPNANLGRSMRHINGVYTQRFNKTQEIDGPLFRGRYKAILVNSDDYLLELSKYIHRNPIEIKNKKQSLTKNLRDYKWSSYPSYLGISEIPKFLNKDLTFSKFGTDQFLIKKYQLFVEGIENKELKDFFLKKNKEAILGNTDFQRKVHNELVDNTHHMKEKIKKKITRDINDKLTVDQIISVVSTNFNITKESIISRQIGRKTKNSPRKLAMYLIQKYKDLTLRKIADIFELTNTGSVNKSLFMIKLEIEKEAFNKELKKIEKELDLWLMERT